MAKICKSLTWVIDRGEDRLKVIAMLLEKQSKFIIRLIGKHNLFYRRRSRSMKWISRRVEMKLHDASIEVSYR